MTTKTETKQASPISRTSAGLRDAIFDELDSIRNGSSNPTRANAVAKLAGSIVETVRMEIEVQKFARMNGGGKAATPAPAMESIIGAPLALGGI